MSSFRIPRFRRRPPKSLAETERVHDYLWNLFRSGTNRARRLIADDLGMTTGQLGFHVIVLKRENRYPPFTVKVIPASPRHRDFDRRTDAVRRYLAECEVRGYLATNQDIGDAVGCGRQAAHDQVNRLRLLGENPKVNLKRGIRSGPFHYKTKLVVTRESIEAEKRAILKERGIIL